MQLWYRVLRYSTILIVLFLAALPAQAQTTYSSADVPKTDASSMTSTLSIGTGGTITDVNVGLDISHSFVNDLEVTLRHPDGTEISLVKQPKTAGGGNCISNDMNVTLDDEATTHSIQTCDGGTDGPAYSYTTYTPRAALSGFDGKNMQGQWTLLITDHYTVSDQGTLNNWSVTITASANAAPTDIGLSNSSVAQSGGINAIVGTLSTTDPDGGDSHTYSLIAGAGDTHNALFNISGSQLRADDAAAMAPGSYNVRIQTHDGTVGYSEAFTVTVVDDLAPVFQSSTPSVSGTTTSQTTLTVRLNEAGTAYYVLVPDGAGAPSANQVRSGQNSSGAAALQSGSINVLSGGSDFTDDLTGLSSNTAYDLYVVAQDDEGTPNVQASVTKVDVTTTASSNADLSNLSLSSGTLSPVFDANTLSYTASVSVNSISVTPTVADASATVTVNGGAATSGVAYGPIALNTGNNTITVVVTAQNGSTKTYDVTVQRLADADGVVTAAAGVSEPVGISTTHDTAGEAIDIFDFTISDGGTSDGLALGVSQIVLQVSGTTTDAERDQLTYRLNGPDVSNVTGTYNAGSDAITFSGLSISVADGGNETYTVNAYWNDNTNLTEDRTLILSTDGDTDFTVSSAGTQMGATAAVTNGTGSTVDVTATALAFSTQPAGSVSGSALTTQPVVQAQDAFGNVDVDFTETITLTEASAGTLTNNTVAAVSGVATFTNLTYTATADQQSFTLTANDQDGVGSDLPTTDANAVTSDVVATRLQFATEPAPTTVQSGVATSFTTVPVVQAVDAEGIIDTGYSTNVILSETNGAGTALLTGSGDLDDIDIDGRPTGNDDTVTLTPSAGVATFNGLQITYTAAGSSAETFNLQATSGGFTSATSTQLTALVNQAPGFDAGASTPLAVNEDGSAVSINDLLAATDPDQGNTLTWSVSAAPSKGSLGGFNTSEASTGGSVTPSGLTYTPTADQNGTDSFDIQVSDGTANDVITVNVTINARPTVVISSAEPDPTNVSPFDVTVTFSELVTGFAASDVTVGNGSVSNVSGSATTYTVRIIPDGDGTVTVDIPADGAVDSGGATNEAAATFSIVYDGTAPNAPTGLDLAAESDTGSSSTDNITSDTTPTITGTAEANATITLTSDQDGSLGTTTADGSGDWSFTPGSALTANVTHSLTATATDATGNTSAPSAALAVTIDTSAPNAPSMPDLAAASDTGTSTTDDLTNDTTPMLTGTAEAGATVTVTSDQDGPLGTTTADGSGDWSFTPGSAVTEASHSLTVVAADAAGNASTPSGSLSITVDTSAPSAPAVPDLLAASDTGASDADDITDDATPDFGGMTEANAVITVSSDVDGLLGSTTADGTGAWSLTAPSLSEGPHAITATATDAAGNTSAASVALNLLLTDLAPTLSNLDGDVLTFTEGENARVLDQDTEATVTDPDNLQFDGGSLTVSVVAGGTDAEDVLGIRTQDPLGLSGTEVTYGGTSIGTWSGGTGGTPLEVALNSNATLAAVQALVRNITYLNAETATPSTTTRTVRFLLDDGAGGISSSADVTVTINTTNDAPVLSEIADQSVEEDRSTLALPFTVSDVDTALDLLELSTSSNDQALVPDANITLGGDGANRTITITPAPDAHGTTWIRIIVSDGQATDEKAFSLEVTPMNDAPQPIADEVSTDEEQAVEIDVLANDTDPDGDVLVLVEVSVAPQSGTVEVLDGGTPDDASDDRLRYVPATDFAGPDVFTYTVADPRGVRAEATVHVQVANVNDAPVAADDEVTTEEDVPLEIDVTANDTDPESDSLRVEIIEAPAHGEATVEDDLIRYVPNTDFAGEDRFRYAVYDEAGATDEATVVVTVQAVNDAPHFSASESIFIQPEDGAQIVIEEPAAADIQASDAAMIVEWVAADDAEGDTLRYRWEVARAEAFAEILYMAEAGTQTRYEPTHEQMVHLLDSLGVQPGASIMLFHRVVASDGETEASSKAARVGLARATAVSTEADADLPDTYVLESAYPNPFNPTTTIRYGLPQAAHVRLVVYDVLGRQVSVLVDGEQAAGWHDVRFEARDLASGLYLYRLETAKRALVGRVLLAK